ncbi:GPP34 family phosphoprotein [Streptomyces albulus]|uniref:GOLPH3/VPS74 family protein n=1 Tax=Streptomyces noursei TaxID=1971 RepID=UPI001F3EFF01|nr:GPP34 family phosphoprotein [Streptomyces noursei]MCE4947776.1 GPP34 family phosphoprotein [Streptomyces noursei]
MTARPAPDLTLPEELLLLGLDPARGRPLVTGQFLRFGLAGAALADLEAAGRIVERDGRVVVARPLPLGHPVLDGALAALPGPEKDHRGVRARSWVRRSGGTVHELCVRQLTDRGALRRQARRALGLFPYERFPAGSVDLAGPARARFAAALDAGLPDPRARTLPALAAACDLDRTLLPGNGHRAARRTVRRLARTEWTAHAVERAVREAKSAAAT